MTIRNASPDDASTLADIQIRAWQEGFAGLMPAFVLEAQDLARSALRWQTLLQDPGFPGTVLVSLDGKAVPVGMLVFGQTRDRDGLEAVGEVVAVNVSPAAARQGHGRALIEGAIADCKARGWSEITLWSLQGNQRADAFLTKLGFKADGSKRFNMQLTQSPLSEMRYRKSLL